MKIYIIHQNPEVSKYFSEYEQDKNQAEVLVSGAANDVTREVLEGLPELKHIIHCCNGVNNVDTEYCDEKGIQIHNAPTANINSTAEHAVGLILAMLRHIPQADASVRAGEWNRSEFLTRELRDLTVGIAGFGRIGKLVYTKLLAFGVPQFLIFDEYVNDIEVASFAKCTKVGFEDFIAQSDIISLHVPLTEHTYHMFNEEVFAKMRDEAMLINTSRGGTVDEDALVKHLQSGRLLAALDVFEGEPDVREALRTAPNCILTPHIASMSRKAQENMILEAKASFEKAIGKENA